MDQNSMDRAFQPINENPLILDFTECKLPYDIHMLLKHKFGLPNFYGRNWSALWDLLDDVCQSLEEPLTVKIVSFYQMPKDLQDYCVKGMFNVFDDAENKYSLITFKKIS